MSDVDIRTQIVAIFLALPNHADELAAILQKDGIQGFRLALGNIALGMSNDLADRLETLTEEVSTFLPRNRSAPTKYN